MLGISRGAAQLVPPPPRVGLSPVELLTFEMYVETLVGSYTEVSISVVGF
jgi:hypothetical protein